jgi:hypothetical protein
MSHNVSVAGLVLMRTLIRKREDNSSSEQHRYTFESSFE